ncbi:trace amine-associated receptor 1-like [Syngnathus acus]|uniref:trace amine-associated receptor 1-like n=1 Tax=Syngnathus acus TaxID=161584 RepID=UPI00188628A5|nr:trace amine-associated receptor 1-like [Syngnathus acus]
MDTTTVWTGGCRSFLMDTEDHLCFPQQPNISCQRPSFNWSEAILFRVVLPLESILTMLLNLLVIISISHFRHMFFFCKPHGAARQLHTPTNLILCSLAVSDFLVGLVAMPGESYVNTSCWFLGDVLCCLWNYMLFISASASVGNMVLISADRYVAICDPLRYTVKVTMKRTQLCVGLCWFFTCIYCGIIFKDYLAHPGKFNSCRGECVLGFESYGGILDMVMSFILPLIIIITLYIRVYVVAVSQARVMRTHLACSKVKQSVRVKKSELKAARNLGVLVLVFLLCFCPYYIVSLMADDGTLASLAQSLLYLYDFNSCVNPFIYALFYPWFQRAIKHIVTLRILKPGSREAHIL